MLNSDKAALHGFSILSSASNGTVRLNNLEKVGGAIVQASIGF